MKLKYQMRGLGVGMVVTALLMGVSAERGIPLSDAEIRAKALELGMVEGDSVKLSDISRSSPEPDAGSESMSGLLESDDPVQTPGGGAAEEPAGGGTGGGAAENPEGSQGAESQVSGNAVENQSAASEAAVNAGGSQPAGDVPDSQPAATASESQIGENTSDSQPTVSGSVGEAGDVAMIFVESGATSYRICIVLEELGLVEDAAEFDTYLCDNGYSRKIDYGIHEIPIGSSEEEIAKIITRNR